MSVHVGAGLSTDSDPRLAALEAASTASAGLDGADADLVMVFASGSTLAAPEAVLEGVHETLAPRTMVGCGAVGVLGGGREVEAGTAVCVWAASLNGGTAHSFHATMHSVEGGAAVEGLPDLDGAAAAVLLPDPHSFPTDPVLDVLHEQAPSVPLLGGVASARTADGGGALFHEEEVVDGGAVGVRLDDVEVLPCVSQGAAPIGPELTVTAADGNEISELAGEPALSRLRAVLEDLDSEERKLVANGLLIGIVLDAGKPEYLRGDFLVRPLLGADPETETVAVGAPVAPGQVVRLHARDADSADEDLREALGLRRTALGGEAPAGSLVFTCNGRGTAMFGSPDHDALTLARELAGAPAAGFFAAGEIGPVGGQSFLHGYTATLAIFPS